MLASRCAAIVMIAAALAAAARGQNLSTSKLPEFEVASVRAAEPTTGTYRANLGSTRHGRVLLTNVTLTDCLRFAFGFSSDSQIAGPDWIRNRDIRFHVAATTPPDTPEDQIRLMLQRLLSERFHLVLHREQRTLPFLALTAGKKGVKLREAREGSDASGNQLTPGLIRSNRLTMPVLAMLLSRFMRQPVVDLTEQKGIYEIKLEWTPDPLHAGNEAETTRSGPSIYSALQEQLGLKMESRKGPLDVVVVDNGQQTPIEN